MRFPRWRHVRRLCALAAVSMSGGGGLSGCMYAEDCSDERMCLAPPKSPCEVLEPGVGPVMDECGVFVSASAGGDGLGAGTRLEPFASLQQAIVEAQARGLHHVYACGETFEEEVTLISGVHLWGGRRCEDGGWSYGWSFDGGNHPTAIAPPQGVPLRVVGDEGATSVIFGVRVVAADASASDGKSSIAMILSPGARVKVASSEVQAGNGKDGKPGEDAPRERAKDGVVGNDGADACTANFSTGALPVVTACDDGTESIGGYGGDGGIDVGGDGATGQPDPAENPEGKGAGGTGAGVARCDEGSAGADGADAGRAAGAVGVGQLSIDGWIGVRGEDGKRGGVGQAGGGGGGSKGRGDMVACRAGSPVGGAAGASGGSGGCGGRGGEGGDYGGASIGIVALQGSVLTLEATQVTAGSGGRGGVGGTGQPGGVGRPGGDGGKGMDGLWEACDGGWGGNGGRGGDAGGGLGGPSYGVASIAAYVSFGPDAPLRPGTAGNGGPAGNASPDDPVGRGEKGLSLPYVQFDAPDPGPPR
ncbi:hypothetical protein BE18_44940 [Sorangium cellulosum]|uniref:PGRS family protein n=1 Tax=Sorangium cellulosum TaxID=56 RepID=A0A150RPN6_SORCE|nr:hypothetical protein BE18_44940 [Sorangium cellulosum]